MSVFSLGEFDQHENVVFGHDAASGLQAIIAIHNTNLGPAMGGCRIYPYASSEDALEDVLRLSRGMTYKSALAGLPLGGGKSVIICDPAKGKSDAMLRAMGRLVDSLSGRYIAAQDSGTSVENLKVIGTETTHLSGITERLDDRGQVRNGDPSPSTAHGVFKGIEIAVKHRQGRSDLKGVKVAIQGVGNVGYTLAQKLHAAGARLWVTDVNAGNVARAVSELGAQAVAGEEIFGLDVDVFAPCAMGGIINDETVAQLRAEVVAGAANNQLALPRHGLALHERGILYAPDYVINAGGIVDAYYLRSGKSYEALTRHVESIGDTLADIFQRASDSNETTGTVADRMAEERFVGVLQ
ncbi:MAG: Glu/Leu/Phe/Val dehydrogenase [Halioglobus sp.]